MSEELKFCVTLKYLTGVLLLKKSRNLLIYAEKIYFNVFRVVSKINEDFQVDFELKSLKEIKEYGRDFAKESKHNVICRVVFFLEGCVILQKNLVISVHIPNR